MNRQQLQQLQQLQEQQAFSLFTFNNEDADNNFQSSFLNTLSSILDEHENSEVQEKKPGPIHRPFEISKDDDNNSSVQSQEIQDSQTPSNRDMGSNDSEESENEELNSETSSQQSVSSNDVQFQDMSSDEEEEQLFQTVKSKHKPLKVVPLPAKTSRDVPTKKNVKFKGADEVKEINIPDSDELDHDTPEILHEDASPEQELQSLVKQLVRLETEELKAKQFLTFIQQHSCFDKQDHGFVRNFLEQIENEKHSLVVVLSNYGYHLQPLITMMTIAERRLELLDQTPLLTPNSSLHTALLEKQQLLQTVIGEAINHVYR